MKNLRSSDITATRRNHFILGFIIGLVATSLFFDFVIDKGENVDLYYVVCEIPEGQTEDSCDLYKFEKSLNDIEYQ